MPALKSDCQLQLRLSQVHGRAGALNKYARAARQEQGEGYHRERERLHTDSFRRVGGIGGREVSLQQMLLERGGWGV